MNDAHVRTSLFAVLKQVLKTRGFTYARLAQELDVTELTIKRLFKDNDCKMSRMMEICDIVGMSLNDLLDMQSRLRDAAQFLPPETEQALADNPAAFVFLVLLVSWIDTDTIAKECRLTEHEIYLNLRELEKLSILEIQADNNIKYKVSLPIRWRLDGPLSGLIKQANMRYVAHCVDNNSDSRYEFATASRLMSEASAAQLQDSLRKLRRDFDYLATQDQMYYPVKDLQLTKFVHAMGPFPVLEIFPPNQFSEGKAKRT